MLSVEGTLAEEASSSKFNQEFEEYRRACREKYHHHVINTIQEEEEGKSEGEDDEEVSDESEVVTTDSGTHSVSGVSPIFSVTPCTTTTCTTTAEATQTQATQRGGENEVRLNASVEALRKSSGTQRRNSLDKVLSFCSKIIAKKPDSPQVAREKEKAKMEREKHEQDFRMARFIAELEMEGRSDQEIQMHLFHLRDQAQFQRPRSNSVGDFFRSMTQAFKDEFAARRDRQCVTVHVATENPFYAAPPPNFTNELGYSYEDLVALEPVPRGITSLDHLPVVVYTGQDLPSSQTTCAICMADFENEEELRELQCSHHFHKECVDKWLSVGTTCPVCKGEVHSE